MKLKAWLEEQGFEDLLGAFEKNQITWELLPTLTHQDLKEGLGVENFALRRDLLGAISKSAVGSDPASLNLTFPEGLDPSDMPIYLAHPWWALCAESHPRVKLHWLTDTAEIAARWVVSLIFADVLDRFDGKLPDKVAKGIRDDIERPTLGRWLGILRQLSGLGGKESSFGQGVFDLYGGEFEQRFASGHRDGTLENSLLMLRNQIAHGGGMSKPRAESLLAAQLPNLEGLIRGVMAATKDVRPVYFDGEQCSMLHGLNPVKMDAVPESLVGQARGTYVLVDDRAIALLPLVLYEPVHVVESSTGELKDRPGGQAPQVYTRAYPDRLSYTPLGRDEAHSEILDVEYFRTAFRLGEDLGDEASKGAALPDGTTWDTALGEARSRAMDMIGRGEEIKVIKDWMKGRDPFDEEVPRVGWISGGPGLGKSILMAKLASDYSSGSHRGFFFHRFGEGQNARGIRRVFLHLFNQALWSWGKLREVTEAPQASHEDEDALMAEVVTRLEALEGLEAPHPKAPKPCVWVLLDNFDDSLEADEDFLEFLHGLMLPGVVWLMCGRPDQGLDASFERDPLAQAIFEGGLPAMSPQDMRAMLMEGLGQARYALLKRDEDGEGGVHNAFVERVVERAKGLPLYVELLLEDLRAERLTVDDDDKLPDGLQDYYDALLDRTGLSTIARDLPLIIAVLARSRESVDAPSLARLLSPLERDALHFERRVEAALRVGQSLLRQVQTPEHTTGYSLYHQSFQEYIGGNPNTEDQGQPSSKMVRVVEEAQRLLVRMGGDWQEMAQGNLRAHLFRWGTRYALDFGGMEDVLAAADRLVNYAYLSARLDALEPGAVFDLIEEFGRVIRAIDDEPRRATLRVWQGFLRQRAHLFLQQSTWWSASMILLQQAMEHADNSPMTRASQRWLENQSGLGLWLRRADRPAKMKKDYTRRVFDGHSQRVYGLISDGDRFLSWSKDGTIKLWDAKAGVLLSQYLGHTSSVEALFDLKVGEEDCVVSWDRDGKLVCWGLESGEELVEYVGHERAILGVTCWGEDRLVSWSEDKTVCVWELGSGKLLHKMTGHTRPLRGGALVERGVLTWSEDKTLRLWDATAGECVQVFEGGHERPVLGAEVFGERVVSWSMDGEICVWSIGTGEVLGQLSAHKDAVRGVMLAGEGELWSWGKDTLIKKWSLEEYKELASLKGHKDWVDGWMLWSPGLGVSWSKDMTLKLWDLEAGKASSTLEGHAGFVRGAKRLNTGELVSWAGGGAIRIWRVDEEQKTASAVAVLEGHTAGVVDVQEGDPSELVSCSWDGSLRTWRWEQDDDIELSVGHRGWIHAHMKIDQDRALTWANDALAIVWDMETGRPLRTWKGHEKSVEGLIRLEGEGDRYCTWSGDYTLRVWDLAQEESLSVMEGHGKKIQGAMELAGGRVVSWSSDATIRVWDVTTGECVHLMDAHKKLVQGVLELEGGRLVSWSSDATVKVWDLEQGSLVHSFEGHKKLVKGARMCGPDEVLSWSSDGTMKLWDIKNLCEKVSFEGHSKLIQACRKIGEDHVLSIGKDNQVILWSWRDGEAVASMTVEGPIPEGATLMEEGILFWFRKEQKRFELWDMALENQLDMISQQDAMMERPKFWQARQRAGRFETNVEGWRVQTLENQGVGLFKDDEGGVSEHVAWVMDGSWTPMVLTQDGKVAAHAGPFFYPLHLYRGAKRVALGE